MVKYFEMKFPNACLMAKSKLIPHVFWLQEWNIKHVTERRSLRCLFLCFVWLIGLAWLGSKHHLTNLWAKTCFFFPSLSTMVQLQEWNSRCVAERRVDRCFFLFCVTTRAFWVEAYLFHSCKEHGLNLQKMFIWMIFALKLIQEPVMKGHFKHQQQESSCKRGLFFG